MILDCYSFFQQPNECLHLMIHISRSTYLNTSLNDFKTF